LINDLLSLAECLFDTTFILFEMFWGPKTYKNDVSVARDYLIRKTNGGGCSGLQPVTTPVKENTVYYMCLSRIFVINMPLLHSETGSASQKLKKKKATLACFPKKHVVQDRAIRTKVRL
jgi:hypothetical protein